MYSRLYKASTMSSVLRFAAGRSKKSKRLSKQRASEPVLAHTLGKIIRFSLSTIFATLGPLVAPKLADPLRSFQIWVDGRT